MPIVRSPLTLVPAASIVQPDDALYLDTEPDPVVALYGSPVAADTINVFVQALGGQESLLSELLVAPELSPPMKLLVQFSLDPKYLGHSLGWLCAKANVTPGDVFLAFRDVLAAKATIVSMRENSQALVPMLGEIIRSTITHEEPCKDCRGKKEQLVKVKVTRTFGRKGGKGHDVAEEFQLKTIPCVPCQGTGTIVVRGDRDAQKMVLDLIGLTKKAGMTINNQNQQTNQTLVANSLSTAAVSGGLAQLQQATSQILFGREATRRERIDRVEHLEPVVAVPDSVS